jgi:hypothetical protein
MGEFSGDLRATPAKIARQHLLSPALAGREQRGCVEAMFLGHGLTPEAQAKAASEAR